MVRSLPVRFCLVVIPAGPCPDSPVCWLCLVRPGHHSATGLGGRAAVRGRRGRWHGRRPRGARRPGPRSPQGPAALRPPSRRRDLSWRDATTAGITWQGVLLQPALTRLAGRRRRALMVVQSLCPVLLRRRHSRPYVRVSPWAGLPPPGRHLRRRRRRDRQREKALRLSLGLAGASSAGRTAGASRMASGPLHPPAM